MRALTWKLEEKLKPALAGLKQKEKKKMFVGSVQLETQLWDQLRAGTARFGVGPTSHAIGVSRSWLYNVVKASEAPRVAPDSVELVKNWAAGNPKRTSLPRRRSAARTTPPKTNGNGHHNLANVVAAAQLLAELSETERTLAVELSNSIRAQK